MTLNHQFTLDVKPCTPYGLEETVQFHGIAGLSAALALLSGAGEGDV